MIYRARTSKGWIGVLLGGFLLALALFLGFVFASEHQAKPLLERVVIVVVLTAVDPICWLGLWLFSMGIGVWRAFVELRVDSLELRVHQFSLWGIRRLRRASLAWNDVRGVQQFGTPNLYAPGGVQHDYILHTTAGRFAMPDVLWPDAEQIAQAVAERIGKRIGDVPAESAVTGDRPVDRLGVRLMRGLGWLSLVAGVVLGGLLAIVCIQEPAKASQVAPAFGAVAVLFSAGAFLRKFRLH